MKGRSSDRIQRGNLEELSGHGGIVLGNPKLTLTAARNVMNNESFYHCISNKMLKWDCCINKGITSNSITADTGKSQRPDDFLASVFTMSPRPLLLVKEFREEAVADQVRDWESSTCGNLWDRTGCIQEC